MLIISGKYKENLDKIIDSRGFPEFSNDQSGISFDTGVL